MYGKTILHGLMRGGWLPASMAGLLRHHQTKGVETDRSYLRVRMASSLLYPLTLSIEERKAFRGRSAARAFRRISMWKTAPFRGRVCDRCAAGSWSGPMPRSWGRWIQALCRFVSFGAQHPKARRHRIANRTRTGSESKSRLNQRLFFGNSRIHRHPFA